MPCSVRLRSCHDPGLSRQEVPRLSQVAARPRLVVEGVGEVTLACHVGTMPFHGGTGEPCARSRRGSDSSCECEAYSIGSGHLLTTLKMLNSLSVSASRVTATTG